MRSTTCASPSSLKPPKKDRNASSMGNATSSVVSVEGSSNGSSVAPSAFASVVVLIFTKSNSSTHALNTSRVSSRLPILLKYSPRTILSIASQWAWRKRATSLLVSITFFLLLLEGRGGLLLLAFAASADSTSSPSPSSPSASASSGANRRSIRTNRDSSS